ncbi:MULTISPECIES: hypothetical protein [Escherichia]|uniref:hypothetical protein n=1 Tax=Escherichia TaxID=561 RepID=UPI001F5422D5|nr:hypothetical protein [Escherichia sp. MOD1-EC5451]
MEVAILLRESAVAKSTPGAMGNRETRSGEFCRGMRGLRAGLPFLGELGEIQKPQAWNLWLARHYLNWALLNNFGYIF